MTSKLKLDAEALEITSSDTAATAQASGTMPGADAIVALTGGGCIRTRLTGPCCEDTRLC